MSVQKIKLEVYSHGVRVSRYSHDLFRRLTPYLEKLDLKEPRRVHKVGMVMELKKRYYGLMKDQKAFFIHRRCLKDLTEYLAALGISGNQIERVDIPLYKIEPAEFEVVDHFVPRDYQIPIIDVMSGGIESTRVDLFTGYGKTACALMAAAKRAGRLLIMIPPKYFGIWIKALRETYKDIEGRYVTVSGSNELKTVMEQAELGEFHYDVVIISQVTYRGYIEAYEQYGQGIVDLGYPVAPYNFHELLGIGMQINDEIQEDPGLVFRMDIYSNLHKGAYLSATPYTGSEFVTAMIDKMLPQETQVPLPEYEPYINVLAVLYDDADVTPKDYLTPFKNTYNHARYEKVMLKKPKRLMKYKDQVRRMVNGAFVQDRKPGQKMLIICALVEFIHHLTAFLQDEFPHLTIGAHVSGSNYDALMTNDITVSTHKSSGTGVDIPDLRELLQLHAMDSKKDSHQILGRLRKMKSFPGVSPRMMYTVCNQIPQHWRYHKSKKEFFSGRALTHKTMRL